MTDEATSDVRIRDGYTARAVEYTELFGDIGQMDEVDRERIGRWADGVAGRILDAGCGPGHWTAFLVDRGADAEGIDLVPVPPHGSRGCRIGSHRWPTRTSRQVRSVACSRGTR